jgi:deoxyribonuclease-1
VAKVFILSLMAVVVAFPWPGYGQDVATPSPEARSQMLADDIGRTLDSLDALADGQLPQVMVLRKQVQDLLALALRKDDYNVLAAVKRAGRDKADFDWNAAYAACAALSGPALVAKLHELVSNHNSISYRAARELMFTKLDNHGGEVECVYTGRRKVCTSIPDSDDVNCEHTWPQSLGATGIARSDVHHLYPADSRANGVRGNLPFGEVEAASWAQGGSECNGKVFQPRPEHRGNVARSIFYFAIRYGKSVDASQEAILRQWNDEDPVDDAERRRNDGIFAVQHNRNPFVDHAEFVGRVADF